MAGGHKSNGFTTERGRLTIVGARTSNGALCFSPVLPGEREEDWLAVLGGDRLGLTITQPLESNGGNGDGALE